MQRFSVFIFKRSLTICVLVMLVIIPLAVLLTKSLSPQIYIDKDYMAALRTADQYLYAWIMRDGRMAYDLVSENVKKNYADMNDFQIHFAGTSNPHHQAFEITADKRLSKDRIRFKVWYYEEYTGVYQSPYKRPEKSDFIELIKVDNYTWLVDNPR